MSNNGQPINLRALDCLRGVLALYVVLGHARWLLWAGHSEWMGHTHSAWGVPFVYASAVFRFGHEAVMVFFVLSGFFIHLRAAQDLGGEGGKAFSTGGFYRRRWHRLGVPYIAALVLTLALDGIGRWWFPNLYLGQTTDALLSENFSHKNFSAAAIWPAVFMLPSSLGQDFGSNGPLWSLSYEVVYYLVYPGWLLLRRKSSVAAGVAVVSVAALGIFFKSGFLGHAAALWPLWVGGALLAEFAVRGRTRRLNPVLLITGAIAVLIAPSIFSLPKPVAIAFSLLGGLGIVLGFEYLNPALVANKAMRVAEFLGARSYTIYICHFPIVTLLAAAWIQIYGSRPLHGWWALTGTAITVGFCLGIFKIVERRYLHPRFELSGRTSSNMAPGNRASLELATAARNE